MAHLGRELLNGLVNAIAGEQKRFETENALKSLKNCLGPLLEKQDELLSPAKSAISADALSLPVTKAVEIVKWFREAEASLPRHGARIEEMYARKFGYDQGAAPQSIAPRDFLLLQRNFVSRTHLRRGEPVSWDEISPYVAQLENVLLPFAIPLSVTFKEVEALVQEANS